MSMVEQVDTYLASQDLCSSSARTYRSVLRPLAETIDSKSDSGHPGDLAFHTRVFLHNKRRDERLRKSTVKKYEGIIKGFIAWCEVLNASECCDLSAVANKNPKFFMIDPLHIQEADFKWMMRSGRIESISKRRNRTMVLLALTCGLSPSDIAQIMPDDVWILDDGIWISGRVVGTSEGDIQLPDITANALRFFLAVRGSTPSDRPLIAITSNKSCNPMSPYEVRLAMSSFLESYSVTYEKVFSGDLQRTIAGIIPRLSKDDLKIVASLVSRLYYQKQFMAFDVQK